MELGSVFAAIAFGLVLAAIIFAIIQILRNDLLNSVEKAIWIGVVIFFPVIGAVVWFVAGPHPFGLRVPRPHDGKRQ